MPHSNYAAKLRRIFGMAKFIWHFNKNSSNAVPSRNESYEEFLDCANICNILIKSFGVKNFKIYDNGRRPILKIISVATSPLVSVER